MKKNLVAALLLTALPALLCVAAAGPLPKLPADAALQQGEGSPGVVTFRHTTHVDSARPDCTTCHSRLFPILKSSKQPVLKHADMEKGKLCGSCHDGKSAHGFDDCTTCHTEAKP